MDRYHVGDALFLQAFARALAARADRSALLICHSSGDDVERLLESKGFVPVREGGRLKPADGAQRALLERGMRKTGRRITSFLTDSVVSAVTLSGADRGLLVLSETGAVRVGGAALLSGLLGRGVVPVVSTMAREEDSATPVEVSATDVLQALAQAISGPGVAFLARGGSIPGFQEVEQPSGISLEFAADEGLLVEPGIARALARASVPVYLATPASLRTNGPRPWARMWVAT